MAVDSCVQSEEEVTEVRCRRKHWPWRMTDRSFCRGHRYVSCYGCRVGKKTQEQNFAMCSELDSNHTCLEHECLSFNELSF